MSKILDRCTRHGLCVEVYPTAGPAASTPASRQPSWAMCWKFFAAPATATGDVYCLVGIYHACHRELCAHEASSPFKIVNFLELVGETVGAEIRDLFKQWKMMQDVDGVLGDVVEQAAAAGLDLDPVREVLVAHMLREQPLPVGLRKISTRTLSAPRHGYFPK